MRENSEWITSKIYRVECANGSINQNQNQSPGMALFNYDNFRNVVKN